MTKNLIAHRGVHYLFQENSLSAFQMAIEMGYIIELDVHLSYDKELVVFHDYTLNRLFNKNKFVRKMYLKDLRQYNVSTLGEVLDFIDGRVPVIIELKDTDLILLRKLFFLLDFYKGDFAIQSFHYFTCFLIKMIRPNFVVGILFYSIILIKLVLSFGLKMDFLGIPLSFLNNRKILNLRSRYIIIGYTIKNEGEYLKYFEMADNFICDIPKGGLRIKKTRDCSPEDSLPKRIKRVG